ncbi:hypothetical protein J7W19_11285 [Streptomyces mobaraensis NBRC 13819 = DSM 40847]|uniref:Uncharacterized protein n=1 Tax=Streptomyces mobaraensis (strain ATCC 29032 / DSM 40847 / JCM 4168 / NBRC 13819 / NCIMB 11159 / IPCR 16-22) TaxID=1223523 RepID=M3A618_STRM1|nr:hypothetical protein [Streptomyces mobaraensis]EMF00559.1 hypothetical protein H340_10980 [Streptomyces mobaraensis NBRC 13819 = DSM 40847]QTT73926.1 hypothetical protein J7W19_11285 [Streptomyces mobaraensis NBRC 13819 = DSM 40847]
MVDDWIPQPLELILDTELDRFGVVVGWDQDTRQITLRPLGGGRTWRPTRYRRATTTDKLRARVSELNREGRRGW